MGGAVTYSFALTGSPIWLLMRWSGLAFQARSPWSRERLTKTAVVLYRAKTGVPVSYRFPLRFAGVREHAQHQSALLFLGLQRDPQQVARVRRSVRLFETAKFANPWNSKRCQCSTCS